jgi:hypothetical protein
VTLSPTPTNPTSFIAGAILVQEVAKEITVIARLINPFRPWKQPLLSGAPQSGATRSATLESSPARATTTALGAWRSPFGRRGHQRSALPASDYPQAIGATDAELARLGGPVSMRPIDDVLWSGPMPPAAWLRL